MIVNEEESDNGEKTEVLILSNKEQFELIQKVNKVPRINFLDHRRRRATKLQEKQPKTNNTQLHLEID
jgi:hypothetical protein